jgi:hypothetical protein
MITHSLQAIAFRTAKYPNSSMKRPNHVENFDSTEQISIISIVLIDFIYGLSDLLAVSLDFGFQSRPAVA